MSINLEMLLREVLAASHRGKEQDERRWIERLQHHVKTNINPLLQSTGNSSGISHNDVMRLLTPKLHPPPQGHAHHLVELEVVTIKHLVVKISQSFSAANLSNFTSGEEPLPPPTTCPEGDLPKAPVILLGVLTSSLSPLVAQHAHFDDNGKKLVYSGLVLADATEKIHCEMAMSCLWMEAIGKVIVATEWNLIHSNTSKSGNYLEIQNCKIVCAGDQTVPPYQLSSNDSPFSVSKMNDHIKDKMRQKNSLLSVYGKVSAVSDVTRNGAESLFLVKLVGESESDNPLTIFVQVPALLHFSVLLRISSCYLFTALKEKIYGKKTSAERMVLSCTQASEIFSHLPLKSNGAKTPAKAASTSSPLSKNDQNERGSTPPMFADSPCKKTERTGDTVVFANKDNSSPPPCEKTRGREGAGTPLLFGAADDSDFSRKEAEESNGEPLLASSFTSLYQKTKGNQRAKTPLLFTAGNYESSPPCKRARGNERPFKIAKGAEKESTPPCKRARETERESTPPMFAGPANSPSPPCKGAQSEESTPSFRAKTASSSPAPVSPSSCGTKVKREAQGKAVKPSEKRLVAYQGVVTGCVCPSAGVYELDGRVRLYLTNTMCSSMGRGIRTGVRVQLHNVAVLSVRSERFKRISGFFCCSLSSLRILKFSNQNSPYSLFNSRNSLSSLTRKYGLLDRAWLLDMFITLLDREYKVDAKGCFLFVSELSKLVNLRPIEGDFVSEFIASAGPLFQGSEADLSLRPSCPSSEEFRAQVMERVSKGGARGGVRWCGGEEVGRSSSGGSGGVGGGSNQLNPEVSYVVKTEWEYAIVKASELTQKQFLAGVVRGCNRTGSLVLQDTSGTWPILATIPQQATPLTPPTTGTGSSCRSNRIISSVGSRVILTDFWVVVERTTSQGSGSSTDTNLCLYVHPIAFSVLPPCAPGGEGEKPSPSLPHPSSSNVSCSSFLDSKEEYDVLFFYVINKNAVMVDPLWGLKFMCTAMVHPDLATLSTTCRDLEAKRTRVSEIERSGENFRMEGSTEGDDGIEGCQGMLESGQIGGPMQVAVVFGKGSFKWYNVVGNGRVYMLRTRARDQPLPAWKVLGKNCSLTVSGDMVIELVKGRDSGECGLDVSDLVRQLMLPPLRTLSPSQDTSPRSQLETVSLSGIIVSRSYRIDHKTLASSSSSSAGETSSCKQRRILALTIQSQFSPDTIVAYCEFKEAVPIPIGLLPGGRVTLNAFRLKTSKSGNPYLTNFALSSIDVDGMSSMEQIYDNNSVGSCEIVGSGASVISSTFELPVRSLGEMMMSLVGGALSRASVCVRVSHVTVHRLVMEYKCLGCQCTITNGRCTAACIRRRPTMEISARFMVEDGSGCGHIYVSGGLVRECLATPPAEWKSVCDLVKTIGRVAYVKRSHQFQAAQEVGRKETVSNTANLCDLDRVRNTMCCWANSPSLQRTFKIVCQPFLSREETERSVMGQRSHTFRMKGSEFSTLSLPRLQLRGVFLIDLSKGAGYARESQYLLERLQL